MKPDERQRCMNDLYRILRAAKVEHTLFPSGEEHIGLIFQGQETTLRTQYDVLCWVLQHMRPYVYVAFGDVHPS